MTKVVPGIVTTGTDGGISVDLTMTGDGGKTLGDGIGRV